MQITAAAERTIDAPAAHLYRLIRDFRLHHPNFLPPQFSDFEIETGGVGAGTVHRFRMTLAGRTIRVPRPRWRATAGPHADRVGRLAPDAHDVHG